jgi:hypothetical protein
MSSPALFRRLDLIPSSLEDHWSFLSGRPVWTNFTNGTYTPRRTVQPTKKWRQLCSGKSLQILQPHVEALFDKSQLFWATLPSRRSHDQGTLSLAVYPCFVSVTPWVTSVPGVLSYFPGLLCGASVLNKIQIPLAACRLDLIKYPTDKGWANASFNIIKRETRVHTSSKANNPFHTLLETLTTVMTTLH